MRKPARLGMVFFVLFLMGGKEALANAYTAWDKPRREISNAWRIRKENMAHGQLDEEEKELERILTVSQKYNLEALPILSIALLNEAEKFSSKDEEKIASRIDFAKRFSPGFPAIQYYHCGFGPGTGSLFAAFGTCLAALKSEFQSPGGRLRLMSNLTYVALRVIAALVVVFGFYLLYRHLGPVTHRWAHVISWFQPVFLKFLTLFGIFLGWALFGPIASGILLMILLWRYMHLGEKVLTSLLVVLVCTIPLLLYFPALLFNYLQTATHIFSKPISAISMATDGRALETWLLNHPEDPEALFQLARINARAGRYKNARKNLLKASEYREDWHKPLVNLALIDFAENRTDQAIANLEKARNNSPQAFLPHFNLGKIYYERTQLEEGRKAHDKAKEIDASLFASLQKQKVPKSRDHFLLEEKLSAQEIRDRAWSLSSEARLVRNQLYEAIFPRIPMSYFWILLMGSLILCAIMGVVWKPWRAPRKCEKCGQPSCAICDPDVEREHLCSQCYHVFVRLESINPTLRKKKDQVIARHRIWKDITVQWSTLLIPGLHRLFRQEFIGAAILLPLSLGTVVTLICQGSFVRNAYAIAGLPEFPLSLFGLIVLGMVYLISLIDAVRH